MNIINSLFGNFATNLWIINLGVALLVAVITHVIFDYAIKYAKEKALKSSNMWSESMVESVHYPVVTIIWLMAIKALSDIVALKINGQVFGWSNHLAKIAIIFVITWFLLKLVAVISQKITLTKEKNNEEVDHTTIDALSKLSKIAIVIIAILMVLQNLGISISGVLAAGGAGGLVVGFAAKDLLANFFGGLTVYLDKPFKVGDWIKCAEKGVEGTVEYIGWRHTRLRAFNKNPIYIPNAAFTTVVVENPSRMSHRRMREVIGLRYCDISKMEVITSEIRDILSKHKEVAPEHAPLVYFTSFGASSIDFIVYILLKNTAWHHSSIVKHEILLMISDVIEKHGAQIAFPTRTLFMENGNDGK